MTRAVFKLDEDKYVEWSTVVDAPVSHVLTRGEAAGRFGEERVARADANGHSYHNMEPMSAEELVSANRAGEDEETLDLDGVIAAYTRGEKP